MITALYEEFAGARVSFLCCKVQSIHVVHCCDTAIGFGGKKRFHNTFLCKIADEENADVSLRKEYIRQESTLSLLLSLCCMFKSIAIVCYMQIQEACGCR